MITKAQAISVDEFHYGECSKHVGPRGGVKIHQEIWRRNGATQTWKTRPNDFRVPVKYGMRTYGQIYQHLATQFHAASECPLK